MSANEKIKIVREKIMRTRLGIAALLFLPALVSGQTGKFLKTIPNIHFRTCFYLGTETIYFAGGIGYGGDSLDTGMVTLEEGSSEVKLHLPEGKL